MSEQIQAREIKAFYDKRGHTTGAFRSDALVCTRAHFATKTTTFLSLSPFRSDYPLPRPIDKNPLKINQLQDWALASEKRMFGVGRVTEKKNRLLEKASARCHSVLDYGMVLSKNV